MSKDSTHYAGKGCQCAAKGESECGCAGADWTDPEIYRLREENAALMEDRRRLDWLDLHGYAYDGLLERGWGIGLPSDQKSNTRNLRAAIDAARKEQP